MIVADTNLLVYLLLPGSRTAAAESVFARDPHWVAPLLWRSEFRNVLVLGIRRGSITERAALQAASLADELLRDREFAVPTHDVLRLAVASGCSAYDCEFVALAQQLEVPLLTADRQVLRKFAAVAKSYQAFVEEQ